jgi:hypothetical protein
MILRYIYIYIYGHIVDDTSIVMLSLHSFKVVRVKRDANEATHGLAK